MSASGKAICGKFMPRAKVPCARTPGHGGPCASARSMEAHRQRRAARERPYDPVVAARWRAAHRLARYGLTQESFDQLLEAQGRACAMCHVPFKDGQPIFIDHDHACCPDEKRSCGACRRGLLCLKCNTALGYIEGMQTLAQAYLASPPAQLAVVPAA